MRIRENLSLKPFNTFGIDVKSRYFVSINQVHELTDIFSRDILFDYPHLILGGGSNILFTDDYSGVVIHMNTKGTEVIDSGQTDAVTIKETDDAEHVLVKVQAGESWDDFVAYCVNLGWGGLENLSLIPGQVGTSPIQNIGAYGTEIRDCFHSLEAFEKSSGRIVVFDKQGCRFGYRDSFFKNEGKNAYVILNVTFCLTANNHKINTSYKILEKHLADSGISYPGISDLRQAVVNIRRSRLPDTQITGNAGSFFKNPVITHEHFDDLHRKFPEIVYFEEDNGMKIAAGWLIEQTGWKAYREGDAGVHHKQALVLVNHGHANGKQILAVAEKITRSVYQEYGINLEPEVNII